MGVISVRLVLVSAYGDTIVIVYKYFIVVSIMMHRRRSTAACLSRSGLCLCARFFSILYEVSEMQSRDFIENGSVGGSTSWSIVFTFTMSIRLLSFIFPRAFCARSEISPPPPDTISCPSLGQVCCLEGLHVAFMRLLFPGRDLTPPALTSPSADGSSKGSSNTAAAAGKRRRGEGTAGEQEEKGAAAAAAGGGEGGNGPVKKRGRKGDGKGESDGATASSAVGAGPGGTGGDTAGQIIAGAAAAAPKGKGGGALARGTPRAAVVLTKDDFRAAALLPAWKAMQPALYSFFK